MGSTNITDGAQNQVSGAIVGKDAPLKVITISRIYHLPYATLGVMDDEGTPFCVTIERPWLNNQKFISSYLPGEYMTRREFYKGVSTFLILNTPGRDGCFIHWGALAQHSEGCTILGENFGFDSELKQANVLRSRSAPGEGFLEFLERTKGLDKFKLVVKDVK